AITIDVPVYGDVSNQAALASARVFARLIGDWQRAAGAPFDPEFGNAAATQLPVSERGGTVYRPLETWVEIPRVGAAGATSSFQFTVTTVDNRPVVQTTTDALGLFRVYVPEN
ncbi:MAG: hypothetical protein AAF658_12630, partial [Myxococcota bacterium]